MCGICGGIFFKAAHETLALTLARMNQVLAHRGKDDEGIFIWKNIGIGHRRLSIVDLSNAGHQPMETERFVISYNGEVYNFSELRKELTSLGHIFKSHTDTEVVLKAFIEWKEKALNKFNGMFAFAVLDKKDETLFLARDRYGIKPLYYYAGEMLLFLLQK